VLQELVGVNDGSYLMDLQRIVAFGVQHVTTCRQCSPRGFICEVCNLESDILYPFDISRTDTVCNYGLFCELSIGILELVMLFVLVTMQQRDQIWFFILAFVLNELLSC